MTDLLTHTLLAYAGASVLSWYFDRVRSWHVPLAMVGAIIPDLSKMYLVLPDDTIEAFIGMPFAWDALHTFGPVVTLTLAGALLYAPEQRRSVVAAVLGGTVLHFVLDSLIIRANGLVPPYFYPLSWWQYPSGDIYLSSTLWPSLVAVAIVGIVAVIDRYRGSLE